MRQRSVFSIVVLAGLLAATVSFAGERNIYGKPAGFDKGDVVKYAVWKHKTGGWTVLWTTHTKARSMDGVVTAIGGKFGPVVRHNMEPMTGDWVKVGPKRHKIVFNTTTKTGIDGFHFTTTGANKLRFNLKIDGENKPDRIFVGANGWNPQKGIFELKNR